MTEKENNEMLRRIYLAVCGDEEAGIEGLVKKVERHDKQLNFLQRITWGFAGAFFVITLIYNVLKLI